MPKLQLDRLDEYAVHVAKSGELGPLSTGEKVYVALAANRADLLEAMGFTLPEAIARLGQEWTEELVRRWQYRGDPRKYEAGEGA